jgi:hypothetical protein
MWGIPVEVLALAGVVISAGLAFWGGKRSADTELKIAREKLQAENRIPDAVRDTIRALLSEPDWELRSFDAIKQHVRGLPDEDLRQQLLACGAIAFEGKETGKELWGLRDRNRVRLTPGGTLEAPVLSAPADGPSPF